MKKKQAKQRNSEWEGIWKVESDIGNALTFPVVETAERPDLLIWNNERKILKMVELTVRWETNDAFDRKSKRAVRTLRR